MMEGGALSTIDDRATGPISESVNGGRSEAKLVRPAGLRHPGRGRARTATGARRVPAGRASPSRTRRARRGSCSPSDQRR